MKIKLLSISLLSVLLFSCGEDKSTPQYTTAEGVNTIISDLKSEFGDGCAFTNLNFLYDSSIGTSITATGGNDFSNNKLESKTRAMGSWTTTEEVTLEIEGDATMRDFMFSIDEMNLSTLHVQVADAVKRVSEAHANMDTEFHAASVFINAPSEIEGSLKVNYTISVEPINGGSSFSCEYDADGTFIEMRD